MTALSATSLLPPLCAVHQLQASASSCRASTRSLSASSLLLLVDQLTLPLVRLLRRLRPLLLAALQLHHRLLVLLSEGDQQLLLDAGSCPAPPACSLLLLGGAVCLYLLLLLLQHLYLRAPPAPSPP